VRCQDIFQAGKGAENVPTKLQVTEQCKYTDERVTTEILHLGDEHAYVTEQCKYTGERVTTEILHLGEEHAYVTEQCKYTDKAQGQLYCTNVRRGPLFERSISATLNLTICMWRELCSCWCCDRPEPCLYNGWNKTRNVGLRTCLQWGGGWGEQWVEHTPGRNDGLTDGLNTDIRSHGPAQ
jgi:hypothetical protein